MPTAVYGRPMKQKNRQFGSEKRYQWRVLGAVLLCPWRKPWMHGEWGNDLLYIV